MNKMQGKLSEKILINMGEYIVARLVELLPEEATKNMQTPDELFIYARKHVPDFNEKIRLFVGDFKAEYKRKLSL